MRIIFILLLLSFNILYASITINDKTQEINTFELFYHFDADKKYNIESIQKVNFSKKTSNFFTFGYTDGDTWFKLNIQNNSQEKQFIFRLLEPYFQRINFYVKEKGQWKKQEAGLTLYKENKDKRNLNPNFSFSITPNHSKTIYIQLAPKAGKSTVCFGRFIINTQTDFNYLNLFNEYNFYLFFFGSMFIIIIFNLFLYSKFRESIYFYYTFYLVFLSIYIGIYSGLLIHLGLAFWHKEFSLSIPLFIIFFILFSNKLLKLDYYLPIIHKILQYSVYFLMLSLPYLLYDYDNWMATIGFSTPLLSLLVAASAIYVVYKGHKEARLYLIGILFYIVALVLLSLMVKGLIAHTNFSHFGFTIFSYLEVLLFSLILIQRFYNTKTEKISLQHKLINIQKDNEKKLEAKVIARTNEVNKLLKEKESLLKEVYHRVKNNFHMITSILWLKYNNSQENDEKASLLELMNRIKSMSLIHQYLLDLDNFSEIKSDQYISRIIDEIKKSYSENNIEVQQTLDSFPLTPNQALALGVIINELLTNSVKYYHLKSSCKIIISCKQEAKNIRVSVKDNGMGFDIRTQTNGLGLKLIEQFSQQLHASKGEFSFDAGMKYELVFKL
jgi:two-component sensor histidine kinase